MTGRKVVKKPSRGDASSSVEKRLDEYRYIRREHYDKDGEIIDEESALFAEYSTDLYGRIRDFQVSGTSRTEWSDFGLVLSETFELETFEQEPVVFPYLFRHSFGASGRQSLMVVFPDDDWDYEQKLTLTLLPKTLARTTGKKAQHQDDGYTQKRRNEIFRLLCSSVSWIVTRIVRQEVVFTVEDHGATAELALDRSARLDEAASENELPRPATRSVRLRLQPDMTAEMGGLNQFWPDILLDVVVRSDDLLIQSVEHIGYWQDTDSERRGLIALDENEDLTLYDFDGAARLWHSNLGRQPIKPDAYCAIWRPGWRDSCGYRMSIVNEHRILNETSS